VSLFLWSSPISIHHLHDLLCVHTGSLILNRPVHIARTVSQFVGRLNLALVYSIMVYRLLQKNVMLRLIKHRNCTMVVHIWPNDRLRLAWL
jgi:hypothetical protein